jgi:RNase H-like domain found in reverse transcriptase
VDEVLYILEAAGVSLNLKKCAFFWTRVDYLGHVVYPDKLAVHSKKTVAVAEWPLPSNKSELRSFVAFCSVYRKFVAGFADIASPLNGMLKKMSPDLLVWNPEAHRAFRRLKDILTSPPVLAIPSRDSQFVLETDAFNVVLGCALNLAESDGALRPVCYYSRTVTTPERNYSATEREALAVVWGVKQARPYLERTSFVIRTDHSALRWLFGASADNQRICRWRLTLAEFRFTVEYKPGPKNIAPDSLSRLPARDPIASDVELDPPVLVIEVPL